MIFNDLQNPKGQNLSLSLSLARPEQAIAALGEIGRQLQIFAQAFGGGGSCVHAGPAAGGGASPMVATRPDLTIGALVREFLLAKARAGRSDRYLRALRNSLLKFAAGRHTRPAESVTVRELEIWLDAGRWTARTRRGYLGDVKTLFNFALRRGYLARNPAAAVEVARPPVARSVIQTPAQVAAVLEFARGYDLNLCRELAIRYFAGLRSSEAARLEECQIGPRCIEIPAVISKTRRRRLVAISDNLRAWLNVGGVLPVGGCHSNVWRRFKVALRAAGLDLPPNVTRHCFCSYHLAFYERAGSTALAAGHTETMLFSFYRELVTAEAAAAFWAIRPKIDPLKSP